MGVHINLVTRYANLRLGIDCRQKRLEARNDFLLRPAGNELPLTINITVASLIPPVRALRNFPELQMDDIDTFFPPEPLLPSEWPVT